MLSGFLLDIRGAFALNIAILYFIFLSFSIHAVYDFDAARICGVFLNLLF